MCEILSGQNMYAYLLAYFFLSYAVLNIDIWYIILIYWMHR